MLSLSRQKEYEALGGTVAGRGLEILYAGADAARAQELRSALSAYADSPALVLLVSPQLSDDPQRNTLTQLALAAHAEGRLVLVAAPGEVAPLGLRDVPRVEWNSGDVSAVTAAVAEVAARLSAPQLAPPARKSRLGCAFGVGLAMLATAALLAMLFTVPMRGELAGSVGPEELSNPAGEPLSLILRGYEDSGGAVEGVVLDTTAIGQSPRARSYFVAAGHARLVAACAGCASLAIRATDAMDQTLSAETEPPFERLPQRTVELDVSSESARDLNVVVQCEVGEPCSYGVALVRLPGPLTTTPAPEVDLAARLDTLEEKLDQVHSSLGVMESQRVASDLAYMEDRSKASSLLIGVAIAIGLQLIALLVLLFRRSARTQPSGKTPAPALEPVAEGPLVFASYSRHDQERVDQIVQDVQAAGVDLWIDRKNIGGGAEWAEEIVRAIRSARGVVLFCSPHAFESDHVLREVSLAAAYGKPLLPVTIEPGAPPDGFVYYLSTRQIIDLAGDPQWRDKLFAALKATAIT